jgi:photosystem II stability/assembly factor-like uncharacterized protein
MRARVLVAVLSASCALLAAAPGSLRAQATFDPGPAHWQSMRWRMIGPHRGGRTKAAAGIPDRPNVFLVGVTNGGVWKTTDYGRTWVPIFDDQPTGSIGAIAIAPSNPDIVYVGSGEGLQRPDLSTGDGVYRSADGGRTWTRGGLRDGQQIPQIVIDPRDPDRILVAVLGHPYGPNEERGVFKSTDGGRSYRRVLFRDANTGAVDVALDPSNPDIAWAVLWESRQAPWENGVFTGPGSGVYKSTDGGETWHPSGEGLPTFDRDGLGRIGITVAPSEPRRLFATVEARRNGGLYRSDDGGERWTLVNADSRVTNRASDFAEVKVHPTNPDIVFTGSIVAWKSTDGGRTFTAFRGAPGGDDYHRIWINPRNPDIILLAADQGVIVTVNGGETFSSWYNQPTAQFYHVSTDNAFPYRVCGGQQESGSACVQSRGDDGQITFREWHPVGVEEYGYVAPDPLDPDIVYGGKVTRYDRRTGQVQNVTPRPLRGADARVLRTAPVLFSPVDPRKLYFATNVLWETTNGGTDWRAISPDLTRRDSVVPPSVGSYASLPAATARHPGVIYTIAPSYRSGRIIWVGSDDGLIHLTRDGGRTWTDVTPPGIGPWAKISLMDASPFDSLTAYAAVNTLRLDDLRPHVWRTRDGGKTWTRIVAGIDSGATINAVRADPKRRGLLYAGSETQVWVSLDDGEHWRSLRLNMPATSIRDLVVKDDDLVVGTHGRSFWILDDVTPLRQLSARVAASGAHLFAPQVATRFRWNKNTDTPLPPEEPAGQNPPDGAIINYWLGARPSGPVTLEIRDAEGTLVRRFSSTDQPEPPVPGRNIPDYWIRPSPVLSAEPGMQRFVWDLHYERPAVTSFSYPIAAIRANTPRTPHGPWAPPGRYVARLIVGGQALEQPLTVRMDPRVRTTTAALREQFRLSSGIAALLREDSVALAAARAERAAGDSVTTALTRFVSELTTLYNMIEGADLPPTTAVRTLATERMRANRELLRRGSATR